MSSSGMGLWRRKSVHVDSARSTRTGGVRLSGLKTTDETSIRNLLELVEILEWREGRADGAPDLEIVGVGGIGGRNGDGNTQVRDSHPQCPRVEIGAGGQFHLPEDLPLLAEVIVNAVGAASANHAQAPVRALNESGPQVIALAEWTPASGAAVLAGLLAKTEHSVLIDASGTAPSPFLMQSPDLPGIRWADLDRAERAFGPDLVERLPRTQGIRILAGDARGVADGADPRLSAVIEASAGRCVLDLGRWDSRAEFALMAGIDYLVLLGSGDLAGASRLACVLALYPPLVPTVLVTRGRVGPHIAQLTDAPTMHLSAAMRRGGRPLLKELRRASGRQWAGRWALEAKHCAPEAKRGAVEAKRGVVEAKHCAPEAKRGVFEATA